MKRAMFRLSLLMIIMIVLSVIAGGCAKEKSFEKGDGLGPLRTIEYVLNEVDSSGVKGSIVIAENGDSTFNVLVNLDASVKDSVHVLHIHNGSTDNPGSIAVDLTPVTGTGGAVQSLTANIKEVVLPDNTTSPMTYEDMLGFDGFVDVHLSANTDSVIAEGKIGN